MKKGRKFFCLLLALALLLASCGEVAHMEVKEPETTERAEAETTPASESETEPEGEETQGSAEELLKAMEAALAESPITAYSCDVAMNMVMKFPEAGVVSMNIDIKSEATMTYDPPTSLQTNTVTVATGGEATTTTTTNYLLEEDGKMVQYTDSEGVWVKAETGLSGAEYVAQASAVDYDEKTVALDETTTTYAGKSAICLSSAMKGIAVEDMIGDALTSSLVGEESDAEIDWSAVSCDVLIYLDPETKLFLAEKMTIHGIGDAMKPLGEALGAEIEVGDSSATFAATSFEPAAPAVLPEGAKENAEAWTRLFAGDPNNGDGSYTIREGYILIDVLPPEGFALAEADYDHVSLKAKNNDRTIKYSMVYLEGDTEMTGEAFENAVAARMEALEAGGKTVGAEAGTVETAELGYYIMAVGIADGSKESLEVTAWAPLMTDGVGSYFLLVEIVDGEESSGDFDSDLCQTYLEAAAIGKLMMLEDEATAA